MQYTVKHFFVRMANDLRCPTDSSKLAKDKRTKRGEHGNRVPLHIRLVRQRGAASENGSPIRPVRQNQITSDGGASEGKREHYGHEDRRKGLGMDVPLDGSKKGTRVFFIISLTTCNSRFRG